MHLYRHHKGRELFARRTLSNEREAIEGVGSGDVEEDFVDTYLDTFPSSVCSKRRAVA